MVASPASSARLVVDAAVDGVEAGLLQRVGMRVLDGGGSAAVCPSRVGWLCGLGLGAATAGSVLGSAAGVVGIAGLGASPAALVALGAAGGLVAGGHSVVGRGGRGVVSGVLEKGGAWRVVVAGGRDLSPGGSGGEGRGFGGSESAPSVEGRSGSGTECRSVVVVPGVGEELAHLGLAAVVGSCPDAAAARDVEAIVARSKSAT